MNEDDRYWHNYFIHHIGENYKMVLNEIDEKVSAHVLSSCLLKMETFFDCVNDTDMKTPYLINYAYCFAVAYMTYRYAKAHGVKTSICSGPYHVFLMREGLIYDVFHPNGVHPDKVTLSPEFIQIQQDCFGEEEVQADTFPDHFYIGSPIKEMGYLTGYFNSTRDIVLFVKKFLNDNKIPLDTFFLSLLDNLGPVNEEIANKMMYKDFTV